MALPHDLPRQAGPGAGTASCGLATNLQCCPTSQCPLRRHRGRAVARSRSQRGDGLGGQSWATTGLRSNEKGNRSLLTAALQQTWGKTPSKTPGSTPSSSEVPGHSARKFLIVSSSAHMDVFCNITRPVWAVRLAGQRSGAFRSPWSATWAAGRGSQAAPRWIG